MFKILWTICSNTDSLSNYPLAMIKRNIFQMTFGFSVSILDNQCLSDDNDPCNINVLMCLPTTAANEQTADKQRNDCNMRLISRFFSSPSHIWLPTDSNRPITSIIFSKRTVYGICYYISRQCMEWWKETGNKQPGVMCTYSVHFIMHRFEKLKYSRQK